MTRRHLEAGLALLAVLALALIGLRHPSASTREEDTDPLTTRDGWGWS